MLLMMIGTWKSYSHQGRIGRFHQLMRDGGRCRLLFLMVVEWLPDEECDPRRPLFVATGESAFSIDRSQNQNN
jgi:hypothetical protein